MDFQKLVNICNNEIKDAQFIFHTEQVNIHGARQINKSKSIWFKMRDPINPFVGRIDELNEIHYSLIKHKLFIICGLGGVGKTELARQYAWKHKEDYDNNVVWINCETYEDLKNSFQKLAIELDITIKTNDVERNMTSIVQDIYRYFDEKKCLLILDNVLGMRDILSYIPSKNTENNDVHILVTSQTTEWGKLQNRRLDVLSENEAFNLISENLRECCNIIAEKANIENLAKILQCLPLALQQATAYIENRIKYGKQNFTVQKYLKLFEEEESLLNYHYESSSAFPSYSTIDYSKTVFLTIKMTLEEIKKKGSQLAIKILNIMAYLAPDGILKNMFLSLLKSSEKEKLDEAVRILSKYSLVAVNDIYGCVEITVHRLVQKVLLLQIKNKSEQNFILKEALSIITNDNMKLSSHSTCVLQHAIMIDNLIQEFYLNDCENQKVFLFLLARNNFYELLSDFLNPIEDSKFLENEDIVTAGVLSDNVHIVRLLLSKGANINNRCNYDIAALNFTDKDEKIGLLEFLFEKGASMDKKDGFPPITFAAQIGNQQMVKLLIDNGADVNCEDYTSPIHVAAKHGHLEIVKILLKNHETRLNATFKPHYKCSTLMLEKINKEFNKTPLQCAAQEGHIDVVKYLLERGGNIFQRSKTMSDIAYKGYLDVLQYLIEKKIYCGKEDWVRLLSRAIEGGHKQTVKFLANMCLQKKMSLSKAAYNGELEVVKVLIENGGNIEEEDDNGQTPLHWVAMKNRENIIHYFISRNVDLRNKNGETPLCIAARYGYKRIVEILYESGAEVNCFRNDGFSPLHLAILNKKLAVVKYLIDIGALFDKSGSGQTPLILAASTKVLDILELFLTPEINVNEADNNENTALHIATFQNDTETVKKLIANGANIDCENCDGQTPLLIACSNGDVEIAEYLISQGASVNHCQKNGFSSLNVSCEKGNFELVKTLLEHEAHINKNNQEQLSPLCCAVKSGNIKIVEHLVKHGANIKYKNSDGDNALHLAAYYGHLDIFSFLLSKGACIYEKNKNGEYPLRLACINGHRELVEYLITNGAEINDKNVYGNTALQGATSRGHLEIVRKLISAGAIVNETDAEDDTAMHEAALKGRTEIVEILSENGGSVNIANQEGYTPLHMAVINGHIDTVKMLVDKGACVNIRNKNEMLPLDLALQKGYAEIVELLLKK